MRGVYDVHDGAKGRKMWDRGRNLWIEMENGM